MRTQKGVSRKKLILRDPALFKKRARRSNLKKKAKIGDKPRKKGGLEEIKSRALLKKRGELSALLLSLGERRKVSSKDGAEGPSSERKKGSYSVQAGKTDPRQKQPSSPPRKGPRPIPSIWGSAGKVNRTAKGRINPKDPPRRRAVKSRKPPSTPVLK